MIVPVQFPRSYRALLLEIKQAVEDFILNGQYIGGPLVEQFEEQVQDYLGAAHAVGCKSGTHALQLALLAAGIGPGDEVITVANTYYATAYAIAAAGATPVFCDVLPENGLLDPEQIERNISERTRALLPVHLYGVPVPLDDIRQVAEAHRLVVVEDCAHAFGSSYRGRSIGADAEFACFSFYPTKSLGAFGDAGMVLTRSAEYAETMRKLRYFSNDDHTCFDLHALHACLDPLQACLLSVMLHHFPEAKRRRQHLAALYRETLAGRVRCIPEDPECDVTPYVFPIFIPDRSALLAYLREHGIYLQVHYFTNLHWLPEFGEAQPGFLPFTERHNAEVVSLSVHPSIQDSEAEIVCRAIIEFVQQRSSVYSE